MRPNHEAAPARRHPLTIHCAYDALRLSFATACNPRIRKGFRFTIGWFDWCGVGKGDGDAQRTRVLLLATRQAALMVTVGSATPPASGRARRDPLLSPCPHVVRRGVADRSVGRSLGGPRSPAQDEAHHRPTSCFPTIRPEVQAASQRTPLTSDSVLYHSLRELARAIGLPEGNVPLHPVLAGTE